MTSRKPSSSARLRTKSGCFECRRQRKKCDERHPVCQRCSRLAIACNWPEAGDFRDRRNRRAVHLPDHSDHSPESSPGTDVVTDAALASTTVPHFSCSADRFSLDGDNISVQQPVWIVEPQLFFQSGEQQSIFTHFASKLLPSLMHRDARPEYRDHLYMLRMGLQSPILMKAMLAVAAIHLSTSSAYYRPVALRNYISVLSSVREEIHNGKVQGSEDYLLATTALLVIFENSRTDALPKIGLHVNALGSLLKLRPFTASQASASTRVFEQIMAESFLYHGVLLMLFDHSFDPFLEVEGHATLGRYIPDEESNAEYSIANSYAFHPVLGMSYRFFLMISDITRLARTEAVATDERCLEWQKLDDDLCRWENASSTAIVRPNLGTSLYAAAARALLIKSMPPDPPLVDGCLEVCLHHGLDTLQSISMELVFSSYYLWPLTVLGSMAADPEDRASFQQIFADMARKRRSGLIHWVQVRLQNIWMTIDLTKELPISPRLEGLRILVEEGSLDCTTVSDQFSP